MTSKLRIDEIVDSTDTGSPDFPLGVTTTALSYTGTLTGGTGVINIGSGQVYKDAAGNVGIGTSSPVSKFQNNGTFRTGSVGAGTTLVVQNEGTGISIESLQDNNPNTKRDIYLAAFGGNVGIGTSSPNATLEVNGIGFINDTASSLARLVLRNSVTGSGAGVGLDIQQDGVNTKIINVSNGVMTLSTGGTERMRISNTGNVGIGVTVPNARLDILNASTRYLFRNNGIDAVNSTNTDWKNWHAKGYSIQLRTTNNVVRLEMESNGRVVLTNGSASRGTSGYPVISPNDSVANAIRAAGYIEWHTDVGAIGVNYFLSDIRKKDNVVPTTTTTSDLINNINFIEFDWKPGSGGEGHETVGVSAQQLKELDESLVSRLSDGYYMVNEPKLVTYMAKALQEQIRLIQELREEINALKGV